MLPLEHSAILLTFIKLPFVIKIFVLSFFERPFYTGFTVLCRSSNFRLNSFAYITELLYMSSLTHLNQFKVVPDSPAYVQKVTIF